MVTGQVYFTLVSFVIAEFTPVPECIFIKLRS